MGHVLGGRYQLVARLARGGMGVVYLARCEGVGGFAVPAVVKRIADGRDDDPEARGMFVREARIMARLDHPNIVRALELGEDGGRLFLALEYVRGFHLGRWLRFLARAGESVPVGAAVYVVERVLDALDYLHRARQADGTDARIVHRDVTPSNVILGTDAHVTLMDFGIARDDARSDGYRTQDAAQVKGKFAYIAPELFRGKKASARSDVFSAGVVLHELLVGHNELRGHEAHDTLARVMRHELSRLAEARPDAPAELDAIVRRATAKRPSMRYATAGEMAAELRQLMPGGHEAERRRLAERLERDFAALPKALSIPSLEDLDATWRDAPAPAAAVEVPVSSADPPARPPSSSRGDLWASALTTGATLAVAAAAVAIAWMALRPASSNGPVRVVGEVVVDEAPSAAVVSPNPASRETTATDEASPPRREVPSRRAEAPLAHRFEQRVRAHRSSLRACAAPGSEPPTRVTLRFVVADAGAAREVAVEGADEAPALRECLAAEAARIRFPAPPATVTFAVPLRFSR